jgi:hypothetical protein
VATYSNYALRVPASLMGDLRVAAERDGVSMNGFIVQAVAEKVAALRARGLLRELAPDEQRAYLDARAERAKPSGMRDVLARAGTATTAALPGDEVPEGWLAKPQG